MSKTTSQRGRVYFITGGNCGLGLETARCLLSKSATVVITVRDELKSEQAVKALQKIAGEHEGKLEVLKLDLADLRSIENCVESFRKLDIPLHCLINNAGVMMCPKELTKNGFELQFGTNHLGHFALTAGLYPEIKRTSESPTCTKQNPCRIVNLSSSYHAKGPKEGILFDNLTWEDTKQPKYDPNLAYGHSKFANVVFTKELHKRLQEQPGIDGKIVTFVVHPGFVDTNLTRYKEKEFSKTIIRLYKLFNGAINVEKGALTQLYAAVSDDPVRQNLGGEYFVPFAKHSPLDSKAPIITPQMQQKLWDVSEVLTGIKFSL